MKKLEAVAARHVDVANHQISRLTLQSVKRLRQGNGRFHLVAFQAQKLAEGFENDPIVIHDQHANRRRFALIHPISSNVSLAKLTGRSEPQAMEPIPLTIVAPVFNR